MYIFIASYIRAIRERLDLLHGSNVSGLDVVLKLLDGLLEVIERDLVILDNTVDLELLDTVTNRDPLGSTPEETVHLNRLDRLEELIKISLVIPRLNIKGDHGLGSSLRLVGLLLVVFSDTLSLDSLGLSIVFIIRAKEVDIVVILLLSSSRSSTARNRRGSSVLVTRESGEFRNVRSNVLEPTSNVGVLLGTRSDLREDSNVSLGRLVALNVALVNKVLLERLET